MSDTVLTIEEWILVMRLKYAMFDERFAELPVMTYEEYLETVDNYWTKADTINS